MSAAFNAGLLVPELAPLRAIAAPIPIDADPKIRRKNPIAARPRRCNSKLLRGNNSSSFDPFHGRPLRRTSGITQLGVEPTDTLITSYRLSPTLNTISAAMCRGLPIKSTGSLKLIAFRGML